MIKPKIGICKDCSRESPLTAGRCSKTCYWQYRASLKGESGKKGPQKRKKPISKKSNKQLEKDIEYALLRKEWLPKHPVCEIGLPGCTVKATQVHHCQGRYGELLTDVTKWKSACHSCHQVITEKSAEAIEQGHSLSRHKKQPDGRE
jgi:hypothetical protein